MVEDNAVAIFFDNGYNFERDIQGYLGELKDLRLWEISSFIK